MVNLISKIAISGIVFIAILYQFVVKTLIFDTLGYGRKLQSIKAFSNVRCEKIDVPGLEACEDMYLHEPTGYLYLACSSLEGRTNWLPALGYLNAPRRSLTDRIALLDTRGTGPVASRLRWLEVENFPGNNGDGAFNLLGVSFLADKFSSTLRILLVNDRPSIDPATGRLLDSSRVGANSTIEHFLTQAGSPSIRYVRTHAHPLIKTPNSVTWVSDHSFVFTNYNSEKVGIRRNLDPVLGGGSVVYCDRNRCNTAVSGLKLPNGVTRALDGLIYVADTIPGNIHVFSLGGQKGSQLKKHDEIHIGLPLDNLSIDSLGNVFVAAFPKAHIMTDSSKNPSIRVPTAIFKISRTDGKSYGEFSRKAMESYKGRYKVEKIIEDDGGLLSGTTAAIHDSQTGRVFLSGVSAPDVMVCETR